MRNLEIIYLVRFGCAVLRDGRFWWCLMGMVVRSGSLGLWEYRVMICVMVLGSGIKTTCS